MTAPERKDAASLVDKWLMEPENYGLRIERPAGSFPSNMGELTPWLVAACECGLSQHQAALDRIAELEGVLHVMIYEITHLSPEESDGSHWCKVRKDTLSSARAVLAKGDG